MRRRRPERTPRRGRNKKITKLKRKKENREE
jgi:hypothetical protein